MCVLYLFAQEEVILTLDNSAQIFNALSDIPGDITDADLLIQVVLPLNILLTFKNPSNFYQYLKKLIKVMAWLTKRVRLNLNLPMFKVHITDL